MVSVGRMHTTPRSVLVVLVLVGSMAVGSGGEEVAAQPYRIALPAGVEGEDASIDERLLRDIYGVDAPAFRLTMRGADRSAYPVFIGAPVVAWGGVVLLREGNDWSDAYRLTAAQVATYGAVSGLKVLFRRARPYAVLSDIRSRSPRYSPVGPKGNSFAFPSGHAALSFAIVTSWSLSHPKWYVIGPGAAWASAVSLSRVWLGVHYPSDVLVGAILGTALAVGVHLVGPSITPGVLEGSSGEATMPMVRMQIRL